MRGPRRPEDLPRLLVALGLVDADLGSGSGPGPGPGLDSDEVRPGRGTPALDDRVRAGLDYWLPTAESLSAATQPARGQPPPRRGAEIELPPDRVAQRSRSPREPVVRRPDALAGGRLAVPVRTAVMVLAIVIIALAVFAVRVVLARAEGRPVAATAPSGVSSGQGVVARASPSFASGAATGSGRPPPSAGGSATSGGPPVVVDIVGQVRHPGVYTLRTGQRVADAVRAAGGAVSPADVAAVNLARVLVDGEQIRIPRPGESSPVTPQTGGSASSGAAAGLVNLNTADAGALDGLPGVGPVLAQRIMEWRTAHGRFTSVDELGEVSGIGEKLLGQLRPLVVIS